MPSYAHFLTADETAHEVGISEKFSSRARSNCVRQWLRTLREPDLAAIFEHSGDEGSFAGFEGRHSNNDSDSDVDLEG